MMWRVFVLLVAVAGAWASELDPTSVTFPELAPRSPSRIVSGWEAEEGQIPFQLSLRMVSALGQVFACGASVIHSEWALTAAHCTANRLTIILRTGCVNLTRPYQILESTEYYNHPLYNEAIAGIVQPNDIGVIKFPVPIELNDRVQPVRIQRFEDRNVNYDEVVLTASGWGALWSSSASPENMNWVYLRGVSNTFCWSAFGGSSIIQDSTICARYFNVTSQSTCQGDSGGPLTTIEKDGVRTIVGVTSFVSAQGCHVGFPAGFIRPGFYHNWFTEVTGVNFDWDWPEEESAESDNGSSETESNSDESSSNSSESDSSSNESDSS